MRTRNNDWKMSRLLGVLMLALLPALAFGGQAPGQAEAGAPPRAAAGPAGYSLNTGTPPYQRVVIRVYFRDEAERDRLATELGAEEMSTRGGYLTVLSTHTEAEALRARGLRVDVDPQATYRVNNPDTFYNGYFTVEEIYGFLDQKVTAYPNLAEKIDIGDSWCKTHPGLCTQPNSWNGFDLYVMHITNRSIPGPKPVLWYDAGIHSREIATPEVAMRFIAFLLDNYNTNADARWLVDYHDIWVMPTLNPDGHHMNESNGNGQPTFHRKNADRDDGCNTYDQFGTDINRNFNFKWGCCGGSSGNACSETYRGPAPESEEETQFMSARVRSLIPDQRGPLDSDMAPITTTGFLINMHSNAEQNLYPWGYTSDFAPNRDQLRNLGKRMSSQSPLVEPRGNGYMACQNTECLYVVDGDEKNWAYGELGIPGYSMEVSGSDFFPVFPCIDYPYGQNGCDEPSVGPGIWPQNKGALLYAAKVSRMPYLLTRGPDAVTRVSDPITVTLGSNALITSTINFNWSGLTSAGQEVNAYRQNVAAAEYTLDSPPWSATGTPMLPSDGNFDSFTEPVQATLDTTGLTLGRHIVFVRGKGGTLYEGHPNWGPVSAVFVDVIDPSGATPTPVSTNTPVPTATATAPPPTSTSPPATATTVPGTATATPTACTLQFTDVPVTNTFYPFVRCLACQGIINGYPCGGTGEPCNPSNDPYFRPNAYVTRGQLAKIVSESAGFDDEIPPSQWTFTDVPYGSTFWVWVERVVNRVILVGYPCGIDPNEPCDSENRPYFRPGAGATRGQLTKIVSNAAGFSDTIPETQYTFTDVPSSNTFWVYVERLLLNRPNVMGGYVCGGVGEPCDAENRPYFRPNNPLTRGQTSKIVASTFFPDCNPPRP
jgi:carboxypeptidase T